MSKRIIDLFHNNNPNELFSIIDAEKLNAVIGLCLFAQDHHPLLDINLHLNYNPVNNIIGVMDFGSDYDQISTYIS